MTRNTGVLDSEDGRIVALSVQEHSEAGILLPEGRLHAIDTHTQGRKLAKQEDDARPNHKTLNNCKTMCPIQSSPGRFSKIAGCVPLNYTK